MGQFHEPSMVRRASLEVLRAEAIRANDSVMPSAVRDYRVLRQIALTHPPLTRTVWRLIGDLAA